MRDAISYDVVPTTVAEAVAARAATVVRRHALDAADRAELGRPIGNEDQGDVVEQDPRAVGYRALAGAILAGTDA